MTQAIVVLGRRVEDVANEEDAPRRKSSAHLVYRVHQRLPRRCPTEDELQLTHQGVRAETGEEREKGKL